MSGTLALARTTSSTWYGYCFAVLLRWAGWWKMPLVVRITADAEFLSSLEQSEVATAECALWVSIYPASRHHPVVVTAVDEVKRSEIEWQFLSAIDALFGLVEVGLKKPASICRLQACCGPFRSKPFCCSACRIGWSLLSSVSPWCLRSGKQYLSLRLETVLWDPKKQRGSQADFLRLMMLSEWSGEMNKNAIHLYNKDGPYTDTLAFHSSRILDLTKLQWHCVLPGSEKAGWKGHTSLVWTGWTKLKLAKRLACILCQSWPWVWLDAMVPEETGELFVEILSSAMLRFRDASGTLIKQSLKLKVQTCDSYTYFIRILPDRLCRKYGGKKKVMWLLRHTKACNMHRLLVKVSGWQWPVQIQERRRYLWQQEQQRKAEEEIWNVQRQSSYLQVNWSLA